MNDAETGFHLRLLRQHTILVRFGERALRSENLDDILTEACHLVGDALGTDLVRVMVLQGDGETLLVRASLGWRPGVSEATVQVADDTSEGYVLKTGKPVISPDIATEIRFRYPAFLTDNGIRALANVVILGGRGRPPFGILQINSREPRAFTDEDTAFLGGYADLIAAAVDRLRSTNEAREGEARLRASVERQRAALETGLIGFFEWNTPARTITADRYFAGFCGLDPEATEAGVPLAALIARVHPDDHASVVAGVEASLASTADYADEFRVVHASGEVRWVHVRGHCTEHAGGRPLRCTGTATDVTASKAAETALRQANEALEARVAERTRALVEVNARLCAEAKERERVEERLRQSHKMEAVGQLTGGVAHDFNNMLQAIGSSLEMLQLRVEQGRTAEVARFVDTARETVDRAAALTHRLLAFARRQVLQSRPVRPDELIEGMAELIRRTVGPAITVELRTSDGIWSVLCDPGQLENVLLNLAINARDAMPGGGTLTIGAENVRLSEADVAGQEGAAPGDYVEIAVTDTGSGMDEATRERAFEPFFTTKPIGQGTGLGLSQLHGFTRQSGGAVHLDSAPGRGTTVRLYLPRHADAGKETEPAGPDRADASRTDTGEVVLLVEDEAAVRKVAAERLRELGYAVLEAADGPAALRLLRSDARVDLLVTDVGLPNSMNGRQVAEAARERRLSLPVLFITRYAGGALEEHLAPGMAVISKPFALDTLAERVRAMLETAPAK